MLGSNNYINRNREPLIKLVKLGFSAIVKKTHQAVNAITGSDPRVITANIEIKCLQPLSDEQSRNINGAIRDFMKTMQENNAGSKISSSVTGHFFHVKYVAEELLGTDSEYF